MDEQYITLGAIEPRQHDHLRADLQSEKPLAHSIVNDQPGVGSAFVSLLRRVRTIDER
jgi:hypothetical protein